jgi:hypothetical protein
MDHKKEQERKEVPFFAQFLEDEFPKVKSDVKAGPWPPVVTLKYPSDDADEIIVEWP